MDDTERIRVSMDEEAKVINGPTKRHILYPNHERQYSSFDSDDYVEEGFEMHEEGEDSQNRDSLTEASSLGFFRINKQYLQEGIAFNMYQEYHLSKIVKERNMILDEINYILSKKDKKLNAHREMNIEIQAELDRIKRETEASEKSQSFFVSTGQKSKDRGVDSLSRRDQEVETLRREKEEIMDRIYRKNIELETMEREKNVGEINTGPRNDYCPQRRDAPRDDMCDRRAGGGRSPSRS